MTIRQGCHSVIALPSIVTDNDVTYRIQFTESCRYNIGSEQYDINKLFGIGYAPHHHKNSVRFGWRYDLKSDMIEILAYWYLNGIRYWHPLNFVAIGANNHYQITRFADRHDLSLKFETFSVPVRNRGIGYLLRPYFGGNMPAPHDITINMRRL